ncbi:hypothetical protein IW261DRAFT_1571781 [Armillaria novae-zelandiae]|uniref:Uncharacterized protein n=1 Tax=Armillaria novae-zelandiae TaxID=153914 RepID=A0AA39U6G5_9AGAR|nr:hypothetical protein IW261DRAFT_1571781 [Armillaria novae-zelandiae]
MGGALPPCMLGLRATGLVLGVGTWWGPEGGGGGCWLIVEGNPPGGIWLEEDEDSVPVEVLIDAVMVCMDREHGKEDYEERGWDGHSNVDPLRNRREASS